MATIYDNLKGREIDELQMGLVDEIDRNTFEMNQKLNSAPEWYHDTGRFDFNVLQMVLKLDVRLEQDFPPRSTGRTKYLGPILGIMKKFYS